MPMPETAIGENRNLLRIKNKVRASGQFSFSSPTHDSQLLKHLDQTTLCGNIPVGLNS
jgi:hypothetical protein